MCNHIDWSSYWGKQLWEYSSSVVKTQSVGNVIGNVGCWSSVDERTSSEVFSVEIEENNFLFKFGVEIALEIEEVGTDFAWSIVTDAQIDFREAKMRIQESVLE